MDKITEFKDNCLIVKIPIGILARNGLYEATRRCWVTSPDRANLADYILGTVTGEVICVIKVSSCNYVNPEICEKERVNCKKTFGVNTELCENRRIEFIGRELKDDKKYLGKMIPAQYIPRQNPVRYTY